MAQSDVIQTILKDSNYHLDLFDTSEIQDLRQRIEGKKRPFTYCPIRGKAVQLKPEELIRQLYVGRLLNRYHYPRERVRFEHLVNFGREKKRADIVILDKDRADTPYIIVEVKKPKLQDGKAQLRSYCNATGAPLPYGQTDNRFRTTTGGIQTTLKTLLIFPMPIRPWRISSMNVLLSKISFLRINSPRSTNP